MGESQAPKRRGLVSKCKAWLRRPATFKTAVLVLSIIRTVARILALFK